MKVKVIKSNHSYDISLKQVCKKCKGTRVIYTPSIRVYKYATKDTGYYEPCECLKLKPTRA